MNSWLLNQLLVKLALGVSASVNLLCCKYKAMINKHTKPKKCYLQREQIYIWHVWQHNKVNMATDQKRDRHWTFWVLHLNLGVVVQSWTYGVLGTKNAKWRLRLAIQSKDLIGFSIYSIINSIKTQAPIMCQALFLCWECICADTLWWKEAHGLARRFCRSRRGPVTDPIRLEFWRVYGDICILIADSLCYTAETNTTVK